MTWENRADRWSIIGAFFVAGWIACSAYYRLPALWAQGNHLAYVQHHEIPKLQRCVNVAVPAAKQAIAAANSDTVPTPVCRH